ELLKAKPLLAANLALARGDPHDAENWFRQAAADSHLPDADRLAVAANLLRLGHPEDAADQLSRLRLETITAPEVLEAARLYQNLGKATEALARFEPLRMRGATPSRESPAGADAGWALLAAASGHGADVVAWLQAKPETAVSDDLLKDLYYAAADRKDRRLALICAERLYRRRADGANRLILAMALTDSGEPADALPHFRDLLQKPNQTGEARLQIEEAYTAALRSAALSSEPAAASRFRAELRQFWAGRLSRPSLDDKQRLDLIYGMLEIKAWNEALPPLAELARKQPELVTLYVESAIEAGRKQEAVVFLKSELDRSDLSRTDREARLEALIEHGGYEVSLPYLRQFASPGAGAWVAAYEEALRKLERTAELAEFWKKLAGWSGTAVEEKRSLAFNMIEAGHKEWAIEVFRDLARNAKPDAADVSDLLFLWGPKPGAEAIGWLEQRARESVGPERAAWWDRLVEAGVPERVAALAHDGLPSPGQDDALLQAYLRSLVRLGDQQSFLGAVKRELPEADDVDRVRQLARLARESGFETAAEAAYGRIYALSPQDDEARHWLGTYAFSRANYSAATTYLKALLESSEGTYDDNFYFAEMLWRKGEQRAARVYYGRALRAIERIASPSTEARVQHAQSLARCGFVEKSLVEFRSLIATSPDKQEPRLDFAAILLENHRYTEAGRVLDTVNEAGGSRLVELRAQLFAATGQKKEAIGMLEDFRAVHPDEAGPLANLALLDQSVERNRQAQSLLLNATRINPENEDFQNALGELNREQAPQIAAGFTHHNIQGAESEDLVRVVGETVLGGAFHLHFGADQDEVSIKSLRSASGTVEAFKGILRRGEASIRYEGNSGLRLEGDLYGSDSGPGIGAAISRPDAHGSGTLRLDLNRPYWEFPETLAGGGTRDRLELNRQTQISPQLSASLTPALNRYSLEHVSGAASSAAAQGRITLQLLARPRITLEYNLDAEYKLSVATRTAPDGSLFHPLPLVTREVHSGGLGLSGQPLRHLEAAVSAGYAADRYGGQAPFITVTLNYRDRGRFNAGAEFERRLYFLNTAQTLTTLGGHFLFRF
ncbi:MAG: hypothetical protein JOZ22_05545, partial [Acidobacteriia bacterium]|nr:hypothetical protein [Terriglobia bacterium]